jgi:gliding motility-associated-like protein
MRYGIFLFACSLIFIQLYGRDKIEITGQQQLSTSKGKPLAINLTDLIVNDPDNKYPEGFVIEIMHGNNFESHGQTIIPDNNFTGILYVPVRVQNLHEKSNKYDLVVEVTALDNSDNVPPTITGQSTINTNQNTPVSIQFSDLTVSDPDNEYPNGFTLTLSGGENYSFVGNTIYPSQDFTGTLTVPVTVNDGQADSNPFNLQISVIAVNSNTPPVITGQASLSTNENTNITIQFSDLSVYDPDNAYPNGFTLSLSSGNNYSIQGNTVIPAQGFSGTLIVPVTVNDGQASSDPFNLSISVIAQQQNSPPVITGQSALSTNQNTSITIQFSDISVSDPDNIYPNGFTLRLLNGNNYSVSGTTVTPAQDFSGTLSVPAVVNDGEDDSSPFNLSITVVAVHNNVPPTITGQTLLSTNENTSITIQFSNISVSDPDTNYPNGFSMHLSAGSNYTVSGTTVIPAQDFSGTLSVPVIVNDGEDESNPFNLAISVIPAHHNTPPTITGQVQLSTNENTAITIQFSNISVSDPDNNYPNGFSLRLSGGSNYTVSGTTVTPAQSFSGTLNVPVVVNDGEDDSNPFNLVITVIAAHHNTAPSITGQVALTTKENTFVTLHLTDISVSDPDDTYPTGFTLKILNGQNYTINGSQIIPATDYFGVLTVPVQVNDGEDDSPVFNLKITVTEVIKEDVKPVIKGQVALNTEKNKPLLIQLSHLTVVDPDDSYPTGFTLNIRQGANYTFSGTVVTPVANFIGTLTVSITVNDGKKESDVFPLKITVVPGVNVTPVITGQVGLSTFKNQALAILLSHLTVNDPDNQYPKDFKLTILPGSNYSVSANVIKPALDFVGTLSVGVTVNDGTSTSAPFYLSIRVVERNVLQIVGQKSLSMLEDSTITLKLTDLIVNDPSDTYPTGYTLKILTNENFKLEGQTIRPTKDFNGNLVLAVQVIKGTQTSTPFSLLIVVVPVNDAPEIQQLETTPLAFAIGSTPVYITTQAIVRDVDNANLIIAEVGFEASSYQKGNDEFIFTSTENIRGIFDEETGILTFVGEAPLAEYQSQIRNIRYNFTNASDTLPIQEQKSVYIKLNDGITISSTYTRNISILDNVKVDIPTAFTPNDDNVNDTWQIETLEESASFRSAHIRVFNRSGYVVFEANDFESPWDGKVNGEFLPADSYFYTIELDLSYTKKKLNGVITILR